MGPDTFDPAVCAGLVVWTDMRNGNPDIYGRDLAGGQEFPIATTPATEAYPDCDGSRVVYMSTSATTGVDILHVRSHERCDHNGVGATLERMDPRHLRQPGGLAGWPGQGQPGATIQIFGTDLDTGAPITVASGSGHQLTPDISGTIVVWEDARGTNPEVWYLDLADGTERQVVMGTAQAPQISGRRAVWQQQAPGSWDIVMKDL